MRTFINAGPAAVDYDDSADEQEASGGREKAGGQGERDGKDDAGKCDGTSV